MNEYSVLSGKKQTKIKHLKTNVDLWQAVFVLVPAEAYESAKFNLTVQ